MVKTTVEARASRGCSLRCVTAQLASGEAEGEPGLPVRFLERNMTTPPEITASTATTIRIGTSGEDPPPSSAEEVDWPAWVATCDDPATPALAEAPWLPCVLALALPEPPAPVDGVPPARSLAEEESSCMEAELPLFVEPPLAPEVCAGAALDPPEALSPVAVGGASEYCTPVESA